MRTVQQTDSHRNRTHIQIGFLNHPIGFDDFLKINHSFLPRSLDSMHRLEDLFALQLDLHAQLLANLIQLTGYLMERCFQAAHIHNHHHVKIAEKYPEC